MIRKIALIALILLIAGASFAPYEWHLAMRSHLAVHYAAHVIVFASLSALATPKRSGPAMFFGVMAIFSLLGFSVELGQRLLLQPQMEWRDVLADCSGAVLGVIVSGVILLLHRSGKLSGSPAASKKSETQAVS